MKAVIKIGTSQYLVEPGQELLVDHITGPEKELIFNEVMLFIDGANIQVGKPYVANTRVLVTLLEDKKGEKIRVAKFKAKSRYRKVVGFRAIYSRIKVNSIETTPVSAVISPTKTVRKPRAKKTV
jgi:large subunit ribosomal protein L21